MKILKLIIKWLKRLFTKKIGVEITSNSTLHTPHITKSNKQKRDEWLKTKGYTINPKKQKKNNHEKPISSYRQSIINFITLKEKGFKVKHTITRNKYGIPKLE